jgi:hypothetical protein
VSAANLKHGLLKNMKKPVRQATIKKPKATDGWEDDSVSKSGDSESRKSEMEREKKKKEQDEK